MYVLKAVLVLLFLSGLQGCALIGTGLHQMVYVRTDSASVVSVNDMVADTGSCYIRIPRTWKGQPNIEVSKPGYWPQNITLKKRMNEHAYLNFILLPGWIIDCATGAIIRYQQPDSVILQPCKSTNH